MTMMTLGRPAGRRTQVVKYHWRRSPTWTTLRLPGPIVAAFAYMLSPYLLTLEARLSVILSPWAGFAVMALYTAVALVAGGVLLVTRDA